MQSNQTAYSKREEKTLALNSNPHTGERTHERWSRWKTMKAASQYLKRHAVLPLFLTVRTTHADTPPPKKWAEVITYNTKSVIRGRERERDSERKEKVCVAQISAPMCSDDWQMETQLCVIMQSP